MIEERESEYFGSALSHNNKGLLKKASNFHNTYTEQISEASTPTLRERDAESQGRRSVAQKKNKD